MYTRLARLAGPAAILGGVLWAVIPLLAVHAPDMLSVGVAGVVFVAIGSAGAHIRYREIAKGFYEEVGYAVLMIGFLLTVIAVVTYSPANTNTIVGIFLSSIPIVAAVSFVMAGTGVLGFAALTSKALPVWSSGLLFVAMPLDLVVYYLQVSNFGAGVSVYGLVWCIVGVALLQKNRSH